MKRLSLSLISTSLISAALLATAVIPSARAATLYGKNLNPKAGIRPALLYQPKTPSLDVEPSSQPRPVPALEQARLNRLDRVTNADGSLTASPPQAATHRLEDSHHLGSVSPLQQMRLDHLNNSN